MAEGKVGKGVSCKPLACSACACVSPHGAPFCMVEGGGANHALPGCTVWQRLRIEVL
jgi:hypothetical protein